MKGFKTFAISTFCVIALLVSGCAPYDPAADFSSAISSRVQLTEGGGGVYQNPVTRRWYKSSVTVSSKIIDVFKEDSVLYPYSGIVIMSYNGTSSESFESKSEAESAELTRPHNNYTAQLRYQGGNGKWELVDGKYFFNEEPNYEYPLNPSRIISIDTPPFTTLISWL